MKKYLKVVILSILIPIIGIIIYVNTDYYKEQIAHRERQKVLALEKEQRSKDSVAIAEKAAKDSIAQQEKIAYEKLQLDIQRMDEERVAEQNRAEEEKRIIPRLKQRLKMLQLAAMTATERQFTLESIDRAMKRLDESLISSSNNWGELEQYEYAKLKEKKHMLQSDELMEMSKMSGTEIQKEMEDVREELNSRLSIEIQEAKALEEFKSNLSKSTLPIAGYTTKELQDRYGSKGISAFTTDDIDELERQLESLK